MAKKLNVGSFLEMKHRLLNTYLHSYKDKLCLNQNGADDMPDDTPGISLTVDFEEFLNLRQ